MTKFYPISLVLLAALLVGTVFSAGGDIMLFLNLPSFFLVVLPGVLMALGNFSLRDIGHHFAVGFRSSGARQDELLKAQAFFGSLGRYILVSGFLGLLTGLIIMLANLGDDSTVGAGTAIALITVVYALFLFMGVVVPFQTGIKKKLAESTVGR